MSEPERQQPGDVVVLEKVAPTGWSWSMQLVRLAGGGVLVHSPTWLGEGTFERVSAIGEPRVLFAPNHFHHLSLQRFRDRWPAAVVVASEAALPRLRDEGHRGLAELESASGLLPPGASWLRCEGTRSGEAWLSLARGAGRAWIVCDAFFHVTRPLSGVTGLALRALAVAPGLRVSRTFRWLALRDRAAYRAWALAAIAREAPSELHVSHGERLAAPDLAARLTGAIERAL